MVVWADHDGQVWRGFDVDRDGSDPLAGLLQHGVRSLCALLRRAGIYWFYEMQAESSVLGRFDVGAQHLGVGAWIIDAWGGDDRFADPRQAANQGGFMVGSTAGLCLLVCGRISSGHGWKDLQHLAVGDDGQDRDCVGVLFWVGGHVR